jgi:GDP-4-dehydro-6-deoxy-D-mannose reductase
VRDAAAAFVLLAERGKTGEIYNVCSGRSRAVAECVDVLMGLARTEVSVRQVASRVRTVDVASQTGDHTKVTAVTGWQPVIDFEQSLADLLDDWRARVSGRNAS